MPTSGAANLGDCGGEAATIPHAAPAQSPVGDFDARIPIAIVAQSVAELRALAVCIDPMPQFWPVAVMLSSVVCGAPTPRPVQSDMAALA